jgi:hypothetical protein
VNPIDKIAAEIHEKFEKKKKRFPFWKPRMYAEQDAISLAIKKYRETVPLEQYDMEMLESSKWGSQSVAEAFGNMRRIILRMTGRL